MHTLHFTTGRKMGYMYRCLYIVLKLSPKATLYFALFRLWPRPSKRQKSNILICRLQKWLSTRKQRLPQIKRWVCSLSPASPFHLPHNSKFGSAAAAVIETPVDPLLSKTNRGKLNAAVISQLGEEWWLSFVVAKDAAGAQRVSVTMSGKSSLQA